METAMVYWGFIWIMEKKMEATIVYWGFISEIVSTFQDLPCTVPLIGGIWSLIVGTWALIEGRRRV